MIMKDSAYLQNVMIYLVIDILQIHNLYACMWVYVLACMHVYVFMCMSTATSNRVMWWSSSSKLSGLTGLFTPVLTPGSHLVES